jgi:hypothetical protein
MDNSDTIESREYPDSNDLINIDGKIYFKYTKKEASQQLLDIIKRNDKAIVLLNKLKARVRGVIPRDIDGNINPKSIRVKGVTKHAILRMMDQDITLGEVELVLRSYDIAKLEDNTPVRGRIPGSITYYKIINPKKAISVTVAPDGNIGTITRRNTLTV